MSDTSSEGPKKKTILIRIEEWTAWIPQQRDPNHTLLMMSAGVTGFEVFENEKLIDVAVSSVGGQPRHFPILNPDDPTGQPVNVKHGLYAFQAVLAANFDGPLPDSPQLASNQQPKRKDL